MAISELNFLPTLPSLLAKPSVPFIQRDLSWLQFNERVLGESRDTKNPLLERGKFLGISSTNLDEFFMIRFSSHLRSISTLRKTSPVLAERRIQIRDSILETVAEFTGKQADTLEILASELEAVGISLVRRATSGERAFEVGRGIFQERIAPYLETPRQFQYSGLRDLKNLQSGLFLKKRRFWMPIPKNLPAMILAEKEKGGVYAFFLDDLILTHYPEETLGMVRLTRDADFSVELDDDENQAEMPEIVRTGLRRRDRGRPVRLQYLGGFSDRFFSSALKRLRLSTGQLMAAPGSFYFSGFWTLFSDVPASLVEKRPGLKHTRFTPRVPLAFKRGARKGKILDCIEQRDLLLHTPYDSFEAFVEFMEEAADDPEVISIEQTIYRVNTDSRVVAALKRAAKKKTVKVMIELRARFDELNNLRLSEELKSAGCEVAFGFGKLKLHAKMVLVTRKDKDGKLTRFVHLSTGNYNEATAGVYTDLAVLTARKDIGKDARKFFDSIYEEKIPKGFTTLLSAPNQLHRRLIDLIKKEAVASLAGERARIVVKVNALVDEEVVQELYQASQAGVKIDLIIRGACSLVPGIQGLSENIRVVSVVDRFLEHSRIYYFGHAKKLYLSSADWMPRNFFSRLELAFPLSDERLIRYIEDFFIPIYLMDTEKSRELTPLGTWRKRTLQSVKREIPDHLKGLLKHTTPRSQFLFEHLAAENYKGTPLE
jgi:polyphosphate kinase